MNLIEQLFNDFNAKYLEEAKARNIDLGLQTVYTPIDKIEKATGFRFADHITAETKSVAILFNTEFINYFIKELPQDYINNIKFTFFYDCKFDYMQVQDCIFFSGNKLNIEMISIENIKDLNKIMAGKKFDIVFSNPPYGKKNVKLDLNILQSIFESAKRIVFIHPSTFIFDKKFKWKQYNDIRNTNFIEKLVTIWGNELFNIGLFCPLCISIWNTDKTSNEVEVIDNAITKTTYKTKINEVSIHGGNKIIIDFYKKIKEFINKNGSLQSFISYNKGRTKFSVKFAIIRGHTSETNGWNDDFFSLVCKDCNDNFCDEFFTFSNACIPYPPYWSFNNDKERMNFIIYCKSKFVRFCLSFLKANGNICNGGELESIPWMDFTQEWNDAKLCKEFGISEELWNYIDNFIPDYYDDYVSGF